METAKISLWEVIIGIWILAIVVILGAGAVIVCFGRNRWQYHGEWTYGSFVPEH